jgi:hypothetical protein
MTIDEPQCDYMSLLLEKTFNIQKDIDIIYDKFFKKFIDAIKIGHILSDYRQYIESGKDVTFGLIDSTNLISKDCKKASILTPVKIQCGLYDKGSFYYLGSENFIQISLSYSAIKYLFQNNFKITLLSKSEQKSIVNELTEERVKSTISHELSHWLSDTLHNKHMTNLFILAKELEQPELVLLKQKNVNMTYFEIDAQIHAIKNLKKLNLKNWNNMTLTDIAFKYTSLKSIVRDLYIHYGKEILDIWQKNLIKRMAREKLLGKNMKHFFNIGELLENYYNKI